MGEGITALVAGATRDLLGPCHRLGDRVLSELQGADGTILLDVTVPTETAATRDGR